MQGRQSRGFSVSELAVGVVLLALAGVILFDAQRLAPGSIYGVGPSAAPTIVAAGLILLGLASLFAAWRGGAPAQEAETATSGAKTDSIGVLAVLGGLIAFIAVVGMGGGFVIATTLLFAATAWAFGARAPAMAVAAIAIGLVLSLLVYSAFTFLLTLTLPQGPLEELVAAGYRAIPSLWQRLF